MGADCCRSGKRSELRHEGRKHRPEAGVDDNKGAGLLLVLILFSLVQLLAPLLEARHFDDMVIYALFIVGPHVGDDGQPRQCSCRA